MIIETSRLTKLFDCIGHLTVVSVGKPDRRSAGISLLWEAETSVNKQWKCCCQSTYCDVTDNLELSAGRSDEFTNHLVDGGRVHLESVMVLGERRLDHFDLLFQHIQTSHYGPSIDPAAQDDHSFTNAQHTQNEYVPTGWTTAEGTRLRKRCRTRPGKRRHSRIVGLEPCPVSRRSGLFAVTVARVSAERTAVFRRGDPMTAKLWCDRMNVGTWRDACYRRYSRVSTTEIFIVDVRGVLWYHRVSPSYLLQWFLLTILNTVREQ